MNSYFRLLPLGLVCSAAAVLSACSDGVSATDSTGENKPTTHAEESPAYLDTTLTVDQRVADLVSRMTLSEKISQLYNESPAIERLGIAEYNWWNEALHGVARAGKATVFPQAIGMAATFDQPLMHQVATVISDEARAKHHYFADNDVVFRYTGLTFWSPNINIFRDPRWGRGQETYGEDPYLTGTLAVQFIKGMQGDHEKYLKTSAMAKHFAVHSGPEKSRHSDDYTTSPKDLRETYLPAFKMAVVDADVESVMCAYNRVNGDPACGSEMLLQEILRDEWQFDGHVVSDCGAIDDFYSPTSHNLVRAPAEAAAWALKAGTDLDCGTGRLSTFTNLHFALQREMVTEADINTAVTRLFKTRFKLGMFDPPEQVSYANIPMSVVGSDKHLQLAQEMSEKSLVLLKNDGLLPLPRDKRVAVIGPNAINPAVLVGNYHGEPINPVLPLDGIQQYLGEPNVTFAPGAPLAGEIYGHYSAIPAENLFHRNEQGDLVQGVVGSYYQASQNDGLAAEPEFVRVDENIDFYWRRSPLDDSVWDEFGVVWQGVLVPDVSGTYRFNSEANITIEGMPVEGPVDLEAGKEYAFGAGSTFLRTWWGNNPLEPSIQASWAKTPSNLADEAVAAAKEADVIIFMGGISPQLEGEEMPVEVAGFDYGDRTQIQLPQVQTELLQRLAKVGKPIVLINFSGSAMALNWEHENLGAIVQAFYPGEATGTALAHLLWGEFSPSGRLPITFYKGVDDLPGFKNYDMKNRTYKYYQGEPLYPFGHGLSYSRFTYSELQAPQQINSGDPLVMQVNLKNTGPMDAAEVTQVYISMPDAPVAVPQRELVAFARSELARGGAKQLQFSITPEQLRYVDQDGSHVPYKGRLKVSVGSGQPGFVSKEQVAETTLSVN